MRACSEGQANTLHSAILSLVSDVWVALFFNVGKVTASEFSTLLVQYCMLQEAVRPLGDLLTSRATMSKQQRKRTSPLILDFELYFRNSFRGSRFLRIGFSLHTPGILTSPHCGETFPCKPCKANRKTPKCLQTTVTSLGIQVYKY